MINAEFFSALCHHLSHYDDATVLTLLVALDADEQPLRTTPSKLARDHLDHFLSDDRVRRAALRLEKRGLVTTRIYPNRWTEYSVDPVALTALLAQPLPEGPYVPGLSKAPIGFLTRLPTSASTGVSIPPADPLDPSLAKNPIPEDVT
jgi:hypothetical protein